MIDADFLEFYRLDLQKAYEEDPYRVYGLIGSLPTRSRTVENSVGGEVLSYSDLMLAKIEFLVRSYIWASSDPHKRGPAPEVDVPAYMKKINDRNMEVLTEDDIESVYDWIYDPGFKAPVENYR